MFWLALLALGQVPPLDFHPVADAPVRQPHSPEPCQDDATPQDGGEIIVTGTRRRGTIDIDTPPLKTLDPTTLRRLGIVSPEVLLKRLGRQVIAGDGSAPLFVVNGRMPITEKELFALPMEAFERVDVMPESVAMRFGYPPTRRVMNYVTKEPFSALEAIANLVAPTDGGAASFQAETQRTTIAGDRRGGLGFTWSRRAELRQSQRAFDYASSGDAAQRGIRTLMPGEEKWGANLSLARPLGGRAAASGTVSVERTRGWSLLGRAMRASSGQAGIIRQFDDAMKVEAQTAVLSHFYGWQWNAELKGSVQRLDGIVRATEGVSMQDIGPGRSRSTLTTLESRVTGNRAVAQLPAGTVALTTTANLSRNSATRSSRLSGTNPLGDFDTGHHDSGIARLEAGIEGTLHIPVASRSKDVLATLGDLAFDARAGVSRIEGFGGFMLGSLSLLWSPMEQLQVNGTMARTRVPPGLGQLGNPLVAQPNTPFFDFTTSRDASVTLITGGQARLAATTRTETTVSIDYAFGPDQAFQASLRYNAVHEDRPVGTVSAATRDAQDAFPELFARDAAGRLRIVRAQPVSLLDSDTKEVSLLLGASSTIDGNDAVSAESVDSSGEGSSYFVSINPTFRLTDRVRLREGLSVLDRLRGGTTDGTINLARARMLAFGSVEYNGIAASVSIDWRSAARLSGGDAGSDLYAAPLTKVDVGIDVSTDRIWPRMRWLQRTMVSLGMENLFNARPRVSDRDGNTPLRFQPALLDSLGRTVSFRLRKLF